MANLQICLEQLGASCFNYEYIYIYIYETFNWLILEHSNATFWKHQGNVQSVLHMKLDMAKQDVTDKYDEALIGSDMIQKLEIQALCGSPKRLPTRKKAQKDKVNFNASKS